MSTKPRTPNLILRGIREQLGMTRVEFAEALGRTSYELGGRLEPTERSITRLENGEVTWPQAAYRQALEALCGRPITELGFTARTRLADGGGSVTPVAPVAPIGHTSAGDQLADRDWPAWFGIRLAPLIGLADGWRYQNGQISALQGILAQEITMFNAAAPAPGEPDRAVFDSSRRQALTTLAALPLAFSTASVLAANGQGMVAAQEPFLSQCAASLTGCWQLLRGSGLPDHPEDDPNYLYADLTPAGLSLKQGLTYLALAEQHEGRGYERTAADVLGRIDQVPAAAVSDRVRYEIANHQARAAVLLDDMDAFELYIHRGLDVVVLLGSRQRLREARQAWQMAADKWPGEPRLAAVTDRLQLTAGATAGSA